MKKIIALITAITVIISILNISAYATSEPSAMTNQEYYAAQSYLIDQYCNGDITFIEWQERQAAVNTKFLDENRNIGDTAYATAITISNQFSGTAQKIASTFEKWGDGARERISDWWNGVTNNVPTETTQTPTSSSSLADNGYGAFYYMTYNDGSTGGYATGYIQLDVSNPNNVKLKYVKPENGNTYHYKLVNGVWKKSSNSAYGSGTYSGYKLIDGHLYDSTGLLVHLYGDVRVIGGESNAVVSDDEFEYGTIKKFDEMPERDLEDLINAFDEAIERNNPDLSTIEGLLRAIYARMGTLDSDNDNDLLASINANILALLEADNNKDENEDNTNEELIKTLLEIRDSLKNGTLGTSPEAHGHEIIGTVYNVIPLDKNWLNSIFHDRENLKVQYEKKTYYLEDCGCLKLGDKYYTPNMNYDSYALSDYDLSNDDVDLDENGYLKFKSGSPLDIYNNLSPNQIRKVNNVIDGIYEMFTYAVPYSAVIAAFAPFEVIIFNTAVPEDVVLNFEGVNGMDSFSVTILSVSFFSNQYVSNAMAIVKPLLMVIIGYCWLKSMRRKIV